MVQSIKILPNHVINKIAAGEVVERPASVVKELVENSIDAGATDILIDIEQAGKRLIRIVDNGSGMSREDAEIAFEHHATSKIATDRDLEAIRTMGFRGEALSSIASVSQIRLVTAERGVPSGVMIEIEGGVVKKVSDTAASQGTILEVVHLFYNTPARLKFLKSPATEFSHILTVVSRQAMAHSSIRFRLTHNKKAVLDLPPSLLMKDRAYQLYGNEIVEQSFEFSGGRDSVQIHGIIGRPAYTRADRTYQDFYVNCRAVKNSSLTHALYSAFEGMLMRDRHPVSFIFIEIDQAMVDVNVHPAKADVRFRNQTQVHDLVRDVIREALRAQGMPAGTARVEPVHGREEPVKEALADYLKGPEQSVSDNHKLKPFPLFGRRKNDLNSPDIKDMPEPLIREERHVDLSHPQPFLSEHGMHPIAQIHESYIIAQYQEGMAVIDQHAAHERVLFEKLQDEFAYGNIAIQNLLIPVQVEPGLSQRGLLVEFLPELNRFGFVIEDFGNGTFMIKAIPSLLIGADFKKLLFDILDEVSIHGKSGKMNELRNEILSVMACHPAIKVHRHLEQQEMETLLNRLFRCRMPHTCPHGRPTIQRFSLNEIQKMFKRI